MGEIFFTGDLHFGHANVIAFDNRPFESVEEMKHQVDSDIAYGREYFKAQKRIRR